MLYSFILCFILFYNVMYVMCISASAMANQTIQIWGRNMSIVQGHIVSLNSAYLSMYFDQHLCW